MKRVVLVTGVAILLLLPFVSEAQTHDCSKPETVLEKHICENTATEAEWEKFCESGSSAIARICARRAASMVDAELNALYRKIRKQLKTNPRRDVDQDKLLIASQKAWINFRDKECTLLASEVEGGSLQPVYESACLADMTSQRIAAFKRVLRDKDFEKLVGE